MCHIVADVLCAIGVNHNGFFSDFVQPCVDAQQFSSTSSFSQPAVSYGLAPPYQVPTQMQIQQPQPGSQPWSGVGGQTSSHSASLQSVQPPPSSVS